MNDIYVHNVDHWPSSEHQCVLVTCQTINFIGSELDAHVIHL